MVSLLNPYLNFGDNAREAMEFYQTVFGGELSLTTFGEFGAAEAPYADKIMHGRLDTELGFTLMGADATPDMAHEPGGSITVSLSGQDDQLRDYWEKLSAHGTVVTPLEKQMWGDEFGMCTDQFGVPWMVNIGQPQV